MCSPVAHARRFATSAARRSPRAPSCSSTLPTRGTRSPRAAAGRRAARRARRRAGGDERTPAVAGEAASRRVVERVSRYRSAARGRAEASRASRALSCAVPRRYALIVGGGKSAQVWPKHSSTSTFPTRARRESSSARRRRRPWAHSRPSGASCARAHLRCGRELSGVRRCQGSGGWLAATICCFELDEVRARERSATRGEAGDERATSELEELEVWAMRERRARERRCEFWAR